MKESWIKLMIDLSNQHYYAKELLPMKPKYCKLTNGYVASDFSECGGYEGCDVHPV